MWAQDQVSKNVQEFLALWWEAAELTPAWLHTKWAKPNNLSISPQHINQGLWESFPYSAQKQFSWAQESIKLIYGRKKITVRSIEQLSAEELHKLGTS